jgi:hypothetical protein
MNIEPDKSNVNLNGTPRADCSIIPTEVKIMEVLKFGYDSQ